MAANRERELISILRAFGGWYSLESKLLEQIYRTELYWNVVPPNTIIMSGPR